MFALKLHNCAQVIDLDKNRKKMTQLLKYVQLTLQIDRKSCFFLCHYIPGKQLEIYKRLIVLMT